MPQPQPQVEIRSVCSYNLRSEINLIGSLLERYPLVSIDTEFPGTIHQSPIPHFKQSTRDRYQNMKINVDNTMLIQLGMCLSNAKGELPSDGQGNTFVWEFNFREFDPNTQPHVPASIQLLRNSGIDFEENMKSGIDAGVFAYEMFSTVGLLFNSNVQWITFQGAYDFAYLVKIFTGAPLPNTIEEFFYQIRFYFGYRVFDLKHIVKDLPLLSGGGLERVAKTLQVSRATGSSHQAGSDSLLTMQCFLAAQTKYYLGNDDTLLTARHAGVLCNLEPPLPVPLSAHALRHIPTSSYFPFQTQVYLLHNI